MPKKKDIRCSENDGKREFDDSVDFAPPHYRKSKYQEVEQLGKQIINEATALEYLEAFEYVEYLVCLLQKDAIKL